MTVSLKLALYPPRYHIIYKDFQKTVADHVFLLGFGSRCDIADVLRTSQLDVEDKCSFAEWAC